MAVQCKLYSTKKESLHFLDRIFSNLTQTHSFEKCMYIMAAIRESFVSEH